MEVYTLATSSTNIFAGTNGGVFLSANSGSSWSERNNGMVSTFVNTSTTNGDKLFVGTKGSGAFLSTNNGLSWTDVNNGLTNRNILSLFSRDTNLFAGTNGSGVFRSTNDGSSWSAVNTGLTDNVVHVFAMNDSGLFAGVNGGVYRSTNFGVSWSSTGLSSSIIYSLAINGNNIFAGKSSGGIFLSTDNGITWDPVNTGLQVYASVNALVAHNGNLFAGTDIGIFLSTDNGSSWNMVDANPTLSLALSGNNLFAGTYYIRVILSTDNGASWNSVGDGLSDSTVYTLIANGTNLFTGTKSHGVWRRPLSQMITSVNTFSNEMPSMLKLEQNYPNPFNPNTIISYTIPDVGTRHAVSLHVYDLLGREVATLVNEYKSAGSYRVQWNASNIPSGVYFYRLQAGSRSETKKLLLLK
jgi:photosystem II stability/assembly factor-like uncharacterized protein